MTINGNSQNMNLSDVVKACLKLMEFPSKRLHQIFSDISHGELGDLNLT